MAITVISWRPTKFTCVCCRPTVCVWQTQLKWKFADLHKVSLRLVTCVLSQLTHKHTFTTYATIVAVHNSLSKFSLWHAPTPFILIKFSPYTQKRRRRRSWSWRRYKPTACIENKILQLLNTFQDMHGTCWLHVRIQFAKHDPTSKSLPRLQLQRHLQLLQLQSQSQARRKPQSQSRPRFQCQLHVHAAFSFPSFPFPLSLWFPVALCLPHSPSIAISCSWVSISLLGRVISSHIANSVSQYLSQRIYLACCLCICITLRKKHAYKY